MFMPLDVSPTQMTLHDYIFLHSIDIKDVALRMTNTTSRTVRRVVAGLTWPHRTTAEQMASALSVIMSTVDGSTVTREQVLCMAAAGLEAKKESPARRALRTMSAAIEMLVSEGPDADARRCLRLLAKELNRVAPKPKRFRIVKGGEVVSPAA